MSIPNETLMAYVDGELDPQARADLEAAMRDDPQIERRIARERQLRDRIHAAYAAELAHPVPDRLLAALRQTSRTIELKAVDLADTSESAARKTARPLPRRARWPYVTSMAASLLLAMGAGLFTWHRARSVMVEEIDGSLVASGALADGLSDRLAGEPARSASVSIGFSFVAKSGDYCRTFSISVGAGASGLACHRANQWAIRVLAPAMTSVDGSQYRTAASGLAPALLAAVQDEIAGDPLDRNAEIAARRRGWRSNAKGT